MNIHLWTEALKKTCDGNSVPPLAIAVGNSDVWAHGVYSIDAFLFASYIYIHHSTYFYFYLIETEPNYQFEIVFYYNHILKFNLVYCCCIVWFIMLHYTTEILI